jgi:acyl-CoA oxidase
VIRFDQAEIPYGYWLSDTAVIDAAGVRDPLTPRQRLARSLGAVGTAVVAATVALTAAARATVAVTARYNTQRLIGHPGVPLLRFPAHSGQLASAIARVYATTCYVAKVRRDFVADRLGATAPDDPHGVENAEHAPWLAADRDRVLAKAAATTALEAVAATCRRLCGFQGVLHANRIGVYEDMARSFHAAGGDTRLLLLEAGKQLLDAGGTPTVAGALGVGMGDPRAVLRLVCLEERVLADQLRHRVARDGADDHLVELERLAHVHLLRRVIEEFDHAVSAAPDQWRAALDAARQLHCLDVLLESAAWHLNQGSLRPGDLDVLRHIRASATERVVGHLGRLVDGLAAPPGRIGGFIGRFDYIDRVATLLPQCR